MDRVNANSAFLRVLIALSTLSTGLGLWSCAQDTVGPGGKPAGVTGVVYDSSGNPLAGVGVYCVYNSPYYATQYVKPEGTSGMSTISKADTFGFNLFQNLPNPVDNSVYLRFSLPTASHVKIAITDRAGGATVFSYSSSFLPGMYQLYLDNFVDSLGLHNGAYTIHLGADSIGTHYEATREMFVISALGSPNAVSRADGSYFFDYSNAFVGDSIVFNTSDLFPAYSEQLGNTVTLLFERTGYATRGWSVGLSPNLQVHLDVVLNKASQQ